jgi:fibronectin type 3 domain-containing protein
LPHTLADNLGATIVKRAILLISSVLLCVFSGCGTAPSAATSAASAGQNQDQSHEVDLSWDAPDKSPTEIVGYHVYRSSGDASSYSLLNASVDNATTYQDHTVQSGSKYSYQVKSIDTFGVESGPSNTVSVTIP